MLILVRHGRTQSNATGLLQGRVDNPLDDVGLRQVEQVALAIGPVDHVITSSLMRSRQTGAAFDAPRTVDDRWIELDYGEYDGLPLSQVPSDSWTKWRTDPHFAPPGGESMAALDSRVRAAAVDLLEQARDEVIVVVSHVSPIKVAAAWAIGGDVMTSMRFQLDQASVTRIAVGPNGTLLRSFNEVLYEK